MFCVILNVFTHPDVMHAGCPSGSSSTTSRGSCLPSFTILATLRGKPPQPTGEAACRISPARLLPSPGTLLAVLHPLEGILHPGHRQGAHVSLLRAAGSLAPESKLQELIDRCDYSNCQLFRCSVGMAFKS